MPHLLELFSGTGSIGKVFANAGWRVTSVDLEPRFNPTFCMNVLDFEPNMVEGHVDLLWGSPPCTHYSKARTRAKPPRDLVGSDRLVQKVLDLAAHFDAPFFMENPQGLLMHRDVVRGISMRLIDYCMYADDRFPVFYRKRTCIWSNTNWCPKRPLCNKQCRGCDEGAGTFREQTANRRSHAKDADMRDIVENNCTQSRPRFLKSCWLL